MVSWAELADEAPEFASRVRRCFDTGVNKTMATSRADGSPRISAVELSFGDPDITLGMMPASRKLADVLRDPRVAIHAPCPDAPADLTRWIGDAKFAGVLVAADAPAEGAVADAGYFRVDLTEVTLVYLGEPADHLVIESWNAGRGWSSRKRH